MIKASYDQIVEKISKISGQSSEEIKRKIEARKAKLSGLISNEGAAQIVAAELGISFEQQELQINDLLQGMKKINILGKVIEIQPIRTFKKNGLEAEVASLEIADSSGSIRTVFWDTHHIDLIKNGAIKEGTVIDIKKADVRGTNRKELHLSSLSELNISDKILDKVIKSEEKKMKKKILDLQKNESASITATLVQLFKPSFFMTCPECNMKATFDNDKYLCIKHGAVIPKKRAIVNAIVDDGSENIRTIFFHENAMRLLRTEDTEKIVDPLFVLEKKSEILGQEYSLSGRLKKNIFFDRNEFIVTDFVELTPDTLIAELSK